MTEPRLEIVKIDRNWYTYLVSAKGLVRMGHGTRAYVEQQVIEAMNDLAKRS